MKEKEEIRFYPPTPLKVRVLLKIFFWYKYVCATQTPTINDDANLRLSLREG